MTLTRTPDHAAQVIANFISQFKEKPKLTSWHAAFVEEIQQIEDAFSGLLVGRMLANAIGVQLDTIGRIVGRRRNGLEDDDYRPILFAWIRANKASGTADDVLDVLALALDDQDAELTPIRPAGFMVEIFDPFLGAPSAIASLVKRARLAGVGAQIVYMNVDRADAFTAASGDADEDSTTQGFASGDDDGTGNGGHLAEVIGA